MDIACVTQVIQCHLNNEINLVIIKRFLLRLTHIHAQKLTLFYRHRWIVIGSPRSLFEQIDKCNQCGIRHFVFILD